MFELKIYLGDFEKYAKNLHEAERDVPFVLSWALNRAMQDARNAEYEEMQHVFDRPTPYTLNSLQITPATRSNLRVDLTTKEFGGRPASFWLDPEVKGGTRGLKGSESALRAKGILRANEYLVPSNALKLDAFGNVPGGLMVRILAALGAMRDPNQNTTDKSRKRYPNRNTSYFVVRGTSLPNGIYLRTGPGRKAVPVLIFVTKASYKPRYPFYSTGRQVLDASVHRYFAEGWERFVINPMRGRR